MLAKEKTIYTIGYDHMTPDHLATVMGKLGVMTLVDVRSVPFSRRPGFSKTALAARFEGQYVWKGDLLGGRSKDGPSVGALQELVTLPGQLMLLCKEESPGDCHRHFTIANPLYSRMGIDCIHVFQDELVLASELQASMDEDRDYLSRPL